MPKPVEQTSMLTPLYLGSYAVKKAATKPKTTIAAPMTTMATTTKAAPKASPTPWDPTGGGGTASISPLEAGVLSMLVAPGLLASATDEYGGYSGGGGGGGGGSSNVTWKTGTYTAAGENVPVWWKPFVPTDKAQLKSPDVAWTVMMNAMIPYLSSEDQARVANQLYTVWGKGFEGYAPNVVSAGEPWEERDLAFMTGQEMPDTSYFMGTQRSTDALATLADLLTKEAGGDINTLGAGYRWLEDVLGGISETGGGETRSSYMQMLSNLDPLLASAKTGDLAAYGPIGQALVRPYFTNFQLYPTTQAGTFGRERGSKFLYF